MFAARLSLGLGYESFLYGARLYWHSWDLLYSINKGVVFGFIIPLISVHMGLRTRGGAEGVGRVHDRRGRLHDHLAPRSRRHLPVALPELGP